jgi:hypothetical protein
MYYSTPTDFKSHAKSSQADFNYEIPMSSDVKSPPQITEHTHLTSLYLTDLSMIPHQQYKTGITISCNRDIGASDISEGHTSFGFTKRFVTSLYTPAS